MGMDLRCGLKNLNLGVICTNAEAEAVDKITHVDCAEGGGSDTRTQVRLGSNPKLIPVIQYHPGSSQEGMIILGISD